MLKPGGRVAVSDIVTTRPLPEGLRKNLLAWAGCVAGALTDDDYKAKLTGVGFQSIEVVVTRVYDLADRTTRKFAPWARPQSWKSSTARWSAPLSGPRKPARLLQSGRDFVIEKAKIEDFPAIHQLLVRSGLPVDGVTPGAGNYYTAKAGRLLGVLGIETHGRAAVLRSFAVEPDVRKTGIGKALIQHAFTEMRATDCSDVYLLTSTAEGYFANYGFVDAERGELPAQVLSSAIFRADCCAACACKALKL